MYEKLACSQNLADSENFISWVEYVGPNYFYKFDAIIWYAWISIVSSSLQRVDKTWHFSVHVHHSKALEQSQ